MKLTHLGFFALPRGQQAHDPALPTALRPRARFGFGARALALSSSGSLWVSGHKVGDLVARVEIPPVGGVARLLDPFRELTPVADLRAARLDELVGLAESGGTLCGVWNEYYDVDGHDGGRVSFWGGEQLFQIGAGELKATSGYLCAHAGLLWCGRSDGAGSADVTHGPVLYEFPLADPGRARLHLRETRDDWTNADRYTALAFLPKKVCWLVQKATGPVWYSTGPLGPNGEVDPWNQGKGWHTTSREVWLLPYPLPGVVVNQVPEPIRLEGFHEASNCGGMCYAPATGRLYVAEVWPPEKTGNIYTGEAPRVHVYRVEVPSTPQPEPPDEEANEHLVRIDVQGVGTFTGSGVWRKG